MILSFSFSFVYSVHALSLVLEIICIILLLIGLFTFDIKMVKYYFSSFDVYYKLFNLALYLFADLIWNNIHREMDLLKWICHILLDVIAILFVLYSMFIDAYQISHTKKVSILIVLVTIMLYFSVCIGNQVYALNPKENWDDTQIVIPILKITLSLRSLMLNTLINFTLFTWKQLSLVIFHPNKSVLPVYPKILWID